MRRDEFREPLKQRGLGERLWARRPSSFQAACVASALTLSCAAAWLVRTPYPFAGEPVVVFKIPPVEEIKTASTTPADDSDDGVDPPPQPNIEVLPDDQQVLQTDTQIIVSPRRSLAPAPIATVSEDGPYGVLPKIGAGNKKPSDVYARKTPDQIIHSEIPKIAIILGGMGLNADLTSKAIKTLPGDITFGFAPYGENLQQQVNRARAGGHEIMLQLPMEPFGYPATNPGPKTLLVGQDKNANLDSLMWHMGRFAGYAGVMNYMGARFLSEPAASQAVLSEIKKRGLFFMGDGLQSEVKVAQLGNNIGYQIRASTVTIDADADAVAIAGALDKLEQEAKSTGFAIGSGSGLDITIESVAEWAKTLDDRGIALVPISAIYKSRRN